MTAPQSPAAAPTSTARPLVLRLIDVRPPPDSGDPGPVRYSPLVSTLPALDLRTAPGPGRTSGPPAPADPPARASRRGCTALPDAEANQLAARLFRGAIEVLAGRRPARQLADRLHPHALARLETLLRTGTGRRPWSGRLTSVHTSQPRPGAIEACGVCHTGTRSRAMAARIELAGDRWLCTVIHLL